MAITSAVVPPQRLDELVLEVNRNGPREAVELLDLEQPAVAAEVLRRVNPATIQDILPEFDEDRRQAVIDAAPPEVGRQWRRNRQYEEGTVGRLMNAAPFVCGPSVSIEDVVELLRDLSRRTLITYGFVVDEQGVLLGVIVTRELLLADRGATIDTVMLPNPFSLGPEMSVLDAMNAVLTRHYPEYPVCDEHGVLLGLVRGQRLFEHQAISISAQAGAMVGVGREERMATPWPRSFLMRHPWLQLNLLTAFAAASVVGAFQGTIDRIVLLAAFLPVLAGQSGNTGCQALAVTLRAMTLGDLQPGMARRVLLKEAMLGALNGVLVGVTAAVGMLVIATMQHEAAPLRLGAIVLIAMTASCMISGASGTLVPIILRRLGTDPATASSIFLTTATDVTSMGLFLALATLLV